MIVQKSINISLEDDSQTLFDKLIPLGLFAMCQSITTVCKPGFVPDVQQGTPTFAHSLKKEDGHINWNDSAVKIKNIIRGTKQWPGAFAVITHTNLNGHRVKIVKASLVPENSVENISPGCIIEIIKNTGFVIKCGTGLLRIEELHPENKKQMSAWAFLQGGHYKTGDKLF